MRFKFLIIVSVVITTLFASCNDDDSELIGNWVEKAVFDGLARANGSSFAIDNYGYWGMGKDYDDFFVDFWKFDPVKNAWSQVADFPGTPRAYNVSISNGKKGYIGLGYDGDDDLSDFWEYDAGSNKWDSIDAAFAGGSRRFATAFAIGDDIYVGTGTNTSNKVYTKDFWKFDGSEWTAITGITGYKRSGANATSLNGKGYVISGNDGNQYLQDFYSYDPATDTWTELNDLNDEDTGATGISRTNASTYAIDGKIYLVAGKVNGVASTSVYEWDPTDDEWTAKTSIETGVLREGAGSFLLNGYGYVVGGRSGSSYKDDCYMFQPGLEKDSDD